MKALLEISRKLAESYIKYENFTKIMKKILRFFLHFLEKSQEIKNNIYKMKNFKWDQKDGLFSWDLGFFCLDFMKKENSPFIDGGDCFGGLDPNGSGPVVGPVESDDVEEEYIA